MQKTENQVFPEQGRSSTIGTMEHGITNDLSEELHSIDHQIARQKRSGIIWMSVYLLLLILALLFFVFGPDRVAFP